MSCNSFINDWNNAQNFQDPSPAPTPSGNSDKDEINNLINMLNNPALLTEGAQGALYGLLMYAATVVQKHEVEVRSAMAQQESQLTSAQGTIAQHQADSIKYGSYAQAAGTVASGAMHLGGAGVGTLKAIKNQTELKSMNKDIDNTNTALGQSMAGTGAQPTPNERATLLAKKERLEREYKTKDADATRSHQATTQLFNTSAEFAHVNTDINAANARASGTLLETANQQVTQASKELADNRKTAGDVVDQLMQLLTLSGNLAKAAVGR